MCNRIEGLAFADQDFGDGFKIVAQMLSPYSLALLYIAVKRD